MKKIFSKSIIVLFLIAAFFTLKVEAAPVIKNNPAEVPNLTYVIGEHQIPATTALTPRRVMLAATTIPGEPTLDNMIIYFKNHLGQWVDAADGSKSIAPPTQFNITASYQMGVLYRFVTGITIDQNDQTLYVEDTVDLTTTITPANATTTNVSWSSEDSSVVTVSSGGLVTGISPGVTNVTVTSECGNKTDTIAVTVEAIPTVANLEFSSVPVDITAVLNDETVVITLTTTTAGADIYYTLDGSEPTEATILYDSDSGLNIIAANQFGQEIVLKARAFKAEKEPSDILEKIIVFKAASEVTVTNANDLEKAIENNDVELINLGASFTGNVAATREGTTDFEIDFHGRTMTGDLTIFADNVENITLLGDADPALDGNLTVSAANATVNNNINISGEIEILAIGPDSWNQMGNALAMRIRAATGSINRVAGTLTSGINVSPTTKSPSGLKFGGSLGGTPITLQTPVIVEIDKDTDDDPDIVVDSDDCEVENLSSKTAQITANKNTIASGLHNKTGGTGEITERQTRPTFDPHSGAVANGTELTINAPGADAIYYTLDGAEPNEHSDEYDPLDKPIIGPNMTVRAMAVKGGFLDSRISQANYTAPIMGGSVTITGEVKFGQTLGVDLSELEYFPSLILDDDVPTYQWYQNGQLMDGATDTYQLGLNDIGATITVVVTADGVHAVGSITSGEVGPVEKADGPAAPDAPTVQSITYNTIILNEIVGAEYRIIGEDWQDSPVFTGLDYNEDYDFEARIRQTPTHKASDASATSTFTTSEKTIDISVIEGVIQPVKDEFPVTTITQTDQFDGTITWMPDHNPYEANTVYTAIITLMPKDNYTFDDVSEDFFTVANAEATNDADSNVVTAIFPATEKLTQTGSPSIVGLPATFDAELTVNPGDLGVQTDLTFTWYRSSNDIYEAGDFEIYEGTTYTPVEDDVGYYLVVVATTPDAYGYGYDVTNIVLKAEGPATPAAPVASVVTDNSILLEVIEGAEYRIDGGTWQDSPEFTGLSRNTTYNFEARIKETNTHLASLVSDSSEITTNKSVVSIQEIEGIIQPVKGHSPVTEVTENNQFTGSVTWNPADDPFEAGKVYTATITLTPKDDFTFDGVSEDFFTVENAEATNVANSNVVMAVFPSTIPIQVGNPGISGLPATYDSELTAYEGSLEVDTNLTYLWYRSTNDTYSGTETYLATGETYTPTVADINNYLIVIAQTPDAYGEAYYITDAVEKADQVDMPTQPTVHPDTPPTKDTITLAVLVGHEYALASFDGNPEDPYDWQDSNIFTGLEAGYEYTFVSRIKETPTHKASITIESDGIQTVPPSSEAKILSYNIPNQIGDAVIDEGEFTIYLEVPTGTDATNLVANFTTSDYIQSIKVEGVDQESGVTENDFTYLVNYMVVAEDGSESNWGVTVHVVDKDALANKIDEANVAKADIILADDGDGVYVDEKWITPAEMSNFNTAIASAQAIFDDEDAPQAIVDQAVTDLDEKITEFENEIEFGLRKYDIVIDEAVSASVIEAGDVLSESILSGTFKDPVTDLEVPGTLAWDDDTIIVDVSEAFNWTFTPDNADYYKTMGAVVSVIALDRSELQDEINAANDNKLTVVVSVDGSDVPTDEEWVTAAVMGDYEAAIATAEAIYENPDVSQEDIDTAKNDLASATIAFDIEKQLGLMYIGSATVEITEGSLVFNYKFYQDVEAQTEITFADVLTAPISLDLENSTVNIQAKDGDALINETGPIPLEDLGLDANGQVVYEDLAAFIEALEINEWTAVPTHIVLELEGGEGEAAWQKETIEVELTPAEIGLFEHFMISPILVDPLGNGIYVGTMPFNTLQIIVKDSLDEEVYNELVEADAEGRISIEIDSDIEEDYTITVKFGEAERIHTVEKLEVNVDWAANIVTGIANPNKDLTVELVDWIFVDGANWIVDIVDTRETSSDGSGNWEIDYNVFEPGVNIEGHFVRVTIADENGNQTIIEVEYQGPVLWISPIAETVPIYDGITNVVIDLEFTLGLRYDEFNTPINEEHFELGGIFSEITDLNMTVEEVISESEEVSLRIQGILNITEEEWDQHLEDTEGQSYMDAFVTVKEAGHTGSVDYPVLVMIFNHEIEPKINATIEENGMIGGNHLSPFGEIEIEVNRGDATLIETNAWTNEGGNFRIHTYTFNQVVLQVGDEIIAKDIDQDITYTFAVELLEINEINVEENTITGSTDPNKWVRVYVTSQGQAEHQWPEVRVQADESGEFIADFEEEYQLKTGDYGKVHTDDELNTETYTSWFIAPEPYIEILLSHNQITGFGFTNDNEVTITINEDEREYTESTDNGFFTLWLDESDYILEPGDIINVTDGVNIREHQIFDLSLVVDRPGNYIEGMAAPEQKVYIQLAEEVPHGPPNFVYEDDIMSAVNGEWSYDFDGTGENIDHYEIRVYQVDDVGNETKVIEGMVIPFGHMNPQHFEHPIYYNEDINLDKTFTIMLFDNNFEATIGVGDFELGGLFTDNDFASDITIDNVNRLTDNEAELTVSGILNVTEAEWDAHYNETGEWPMFGEVKVKASAYDGEEDYTFFVGVTKYHEEPFLDPHIYLTYWEDETYIFVHHFPENTDIELLIKRGDDIKQQNDEKTTNEGGYQSYHIVDFTLAENDEIIVKTDDEEVEVSLIYKDFIFIVNQEENKITGTATPNSPIKAVVAYIDKEGYADSDEHGNWEVDFEGIHDLDYGDEGRIYVFNEEWSAVYKHWNIEAQATAAPNRINVPIYDAHHGVDIHVEFDLKIEDGEFNDELTTENFELGGVFDDGDITFADLYIHDVDNNAHYNDRYFVTVSGTLNISEEDWQSGHWQDKLGEILIKEDAHTGIGDLRVVVMVAPDHDNGDHYEPTPQVLVFRGHGGYINLVDWPNHTEVEITIERDGEIDPLFTGTQTTSAEDYISIHVPSDLGYEGGLEVGDTVTVSASEITIEVVIQLLNVLEINPENNTISGIAPENQTIRGEIHAEGHPYLETQSSEAGAWEIDFTGTYNITEDTMGHVLLTDEEGNGTITYWQHQNPGFVVFIQDDSLVGYEWPSETEITIEINNDEVGTVTTDSMGWFDFNYEFSVDDEVSVTDGINERNLTVQYIEFTSVDRETEVGTVSGQALEGTEVMITVEESRPDGPPIEHFSGVAIADSDENWTIDVNLKIEANYDVYALILGADETTATVVVDRGTDE